ncbi:MAG TPA: hypothetical protein VIL46_02935, partial [Gemmataceae bacterium]
MVFQATTRGWRGVAVGLLLLPALAQGDGVARAQSPRTPTGPGVHAGTATGGKAGGAPAGQSPGEAARQLMKQA